MLLWVVLCVGLASAYGQLPDTDKHVTPWMREVTLRLDRDEQLISELRLELDRVKTTNLEFKKMADRCVMREVEKPNPTTHNDSPVDTAVDGVSDVRNDTDTSSPETVTLSPSTHRRPNTGVRDSPCPRQSTDTVVSDSTSTRQNTDTGVSDSPSPRQSTDTGVSGSPSPRQNTDTGVSDSPSPRQSIRTDPKVRGSPRPRNSSDTDVRDSTLTRAGGISTIAFYATLKHGINNPGENHVIDFDGIITNLGGFLDPHGTGIFRCGVDGTYVFSWTVYIGDNQQMDSHLVLNGVMVGKTLIVSPYDNWRSTTGVAILQLNSGDDVYVRVFNPRNSADVIGPGSAFSGFRVL